MSQKQLSEFTNEELVLEEKKRKSSVTIYAILVALMIGVGIYRTMKNGFGAFSVLPLVFLFIALSLYNNYQAVKKEIASRKTL
ncbi:hypothetical protein ACLOAU_18350 [Niabella sp. CJ426]|uniref:hypothetical protein n=1 Tax=Niabella sp. CJ426 TaxID=3393740 RepID=UPI003CFBC693